MNLGQLTASLCFAAMITGWLSSSLQAEANSATKASLDETRAVSQLLKNSKQFKICAESLDMGSARQGSRAYKLNNQTYFVMIQCFLGAYQGGYEFFLYSPTAKSNPVKPLSLTEFEQTETGQIKKTESFEVGGLPTYNPKQRTLTVQSKYRGVGDCGAMGRYHLENNALKLVNFKAKFTCDGKLAPYQQIFPTK
jgi:hypothetical protein